MRNWLVRIGWSHGDQELFSSAEIAALFGLAEVHRSSGQADPGKLDWLNQHYIKERPRDRLVDELLPFLAAAGTPVEPSPALGELVDLLRERSKTLVEMAERARFFAVDDAALAYDADAVRKHWKPNAVPALKDLAADLERTTAWELASIEAAFHATLARHEGLALGKLAQPVRIAVTGSAASPGIFETLLVLGRDRTVARIRRALAELPSS
jgi:glutamyl-tRNA synthetase